MVADLMVLNAIPLWDAGDDAQEQQVVRRGVADSAGSLSAAEQPHSGFPADFSASSRAQHADVSLTAGPPQQMMPERMFAGQERQGPQKRCLLVADRAAPRQ